MNDFINHEFQSRNTLVKLKKLVKKKIEKTGKEKKRRDIRDNLIIYQKKKSSHFYNHNTKPYDKRY